MTLAQAVETRLSDMYAVMAEAGLTELTGKAKYRGEAHAGYTGYRETAGRFRGIKHASPAIA